MARITEEMRERHRRFLEEERKDAVEVAPRVRVSPTFITGGGGGEVEVARSTSIAEKQVSKTPAQLTGEYAKQVAEYREQQRQEQIAKREQQQQTFIRRRGFERRAEVTKEGLTIPLRRGTLIISPTITEPKTRRELILSGEVSPTIRDVLPAQSKAQRKLRDKIALQTYVDIKVSEQTRRLNKQITKHVKEGTSLKYLLTREIPISSGAIGKFILFSPTMTTGREALSGAIKRGDVKPVVETKFKAVLEPKQQGAVVRTMAKTKAGGKEVIGVSKEAIRETGKRSFIGIGKGKTVTRISQGKIRQVIKDIKIMGGGRELGKAELVKDIRLVGVPKPMRVSTDAGKGIFTQTYVKEISSRKIFEGLAMKIKPTRAIFTQKLKPSKQVFKQDVIGIIKPTKEPRTFGFVGTTEKGTITKIISKEGIATKFRFTDTNIQGIIKVSTKPVKAIPKPTTETNIQQVALQRFAEKTGQVQAVAQPQLSQQVQRVIGTQAGALHKTAEVQILQSATRTPPLPKIVPVAQTKPTPTTALTFQRTFIPSVQKTVVPSVDIQKLPTAPTVTVTPAVTVGVTEKTVTKQVPQVRQDIKQLPVTRQIPREALIEETRLKAGLKQVQQVRLKQLQRQKLVPRLMGDFGYRIGFGRGFRIPKVPIVPYKIGKGKGLPRSATPRGVAREDYGFSESFSAKVLGLKPIKLKKKEALALSKKLERGIGLRRGIVIK